MTGWLIVGTFALVATPIGIAQIIYGAIRKRKRLVIIGASWLTVLWVGIVVLDHVKPTFMGDWP